MTRFLFIHDFFRDGREDLLAEVRVLQHSGQWTVEKRARWIKQAVSYREQLRHNDPGVPQVRAYYAGRIVALKSQCTASFSPKAETQKPLPDQTVFHPLKPGDERRCSLFECESDAVWGIRPPGESKPYLVLCDVCRQEWQRIETAYSTPDGWDWDKDDENTLPLMVVPRTQKLARLEEDAEALSETVLPLSFLLGCDLSALLSHGSHPMMITGLLIALLLRWQSKNIVRLLFSCSRTLESYEDREGEDQ